jgi:hypothetical protein
MNRPAAIQVCAAVLLVTWGLVACGGSGATTSLPQTRGRITLTVNWPTSREIPAEARSIKVVAKVLQPENGPQVGEEIVERPANQTTSQIVLDDIPSVKVRLTATAYESTNGTGEVIASGTTEVTVPENNSVTANILMTAEDEPTECPFFSARFGTTTATSTDSIASVSGAYASHTGVFATIFSAGTAEAHSKSVFVVVAPSGTIPITLRFRSHIEDEQVSEETHSGTVAIQSSVLSQTFNQFGDQEITAPMAVQNGQVFIVNLDLSITSSANTGVTATGDLFFENLPSGVSVNRVHCP